MSASVLTLACAMAAADGSAVRAQTKSDPQQGVVGTKPDASAVEEVVVTGTRTTGLRAVDSPAPIQVLDSSSLKRVGQPDLRQALAQNVPSFTAQAFGGDTANLTLSARLRGLSPNQALVLIDGKRRHGTANLAVLGGPYQGSAAPDLNFVPIDSIDHIEVLQEGAAAQYGTDAIAGVINIILKDQSHGGLLSTNAGEYFDEGGETFNASGNIGFAPTDKSFLNVTAEYKWHDFSFRGGIDPRVLNTPFNVGGNRLSAYPGIAALSDYPYVNRIQGDARYRLYNVTYNAGYHLTDEIDLYSFGSYGHKVASAFENYRVPTRVVSSTGLRLFPLGFDPREGITEDDFQVTGGIKGTTSGWHWDLSTTYGQDNDSVNTLDSANASLYFDTGFTPTGFHDGNFFSSQWTSNLDVSRDFDVGFVKPVTIAFGGEYRQEEYDINAGDPASRYKEGSQSFPGFALTDAGNHSRDNEAVYADIAATPITNLSLDLAGRFEHFSDFGSTAVGKLTARYDFTPMFALRGTVSTGFRAPTLAEEFYSATNVSPTSAFVQLPPNSAAAKLVGINGLKPEESTNFSVGFVSRPISRMTLTVDGYLIQLDDRVVGSGALYGSGGSVNSPAVTAAILANGNVLDPTVTFTGINIFANGLDTRTYGVDAVLTYSSDYGEWGHVDWSVSANYNKTEVTKIKATPSQLAPQTFYDANAISYLEDASPEYRFIFGALWTKGPWTVNLRETIFGETSDKESYDGAVYYQNTIGVTPITDLEIGYRIGPVKLAVGANNLFDEYPDQVNPILQNIYLQNNDNTAVTIYPSFSPFGINGGYYYGRVTYSF